MSSFNFRLSFLNLVLLFIRVSIVFGIWPLEAESLESNLLSAVASQRDASINSSDSNANKSFHSIDIGIDSTELWYLNVSLSNQKQQLRVDISQPYLWVVDATSNADFSGTTYAVNESTSSPYAGNLGYNMIYNMSFIDNVFINSSAYMSFMSIEGITYDDSETKEIDINVSTIGFLDAYYASALIGAFGLGGEINDTNWQQNQIGTNFFNSSFLTFEALKSEGTIGSRGYSMWLAGNVGNDVDLSQYVSENLTYVYSNFSVGSLMLNYVNSSLFTGELVKFKSIPYYEVFTEGQSFSSNGYPIFPLSGVNVIANNSATVNLTSSNDITAVMVDSRFAISYLPIDIIQQLTIQTDAFYVESVGSWYVDCELGNINADLEFLFGQLSIKVPLSEFIAEAYLGSTDLEKSQLYFMSASGVEIPACAVKVKPNYLSGINILGSSFLKYAYLAADLEANEFALAQAANIYGESLNTASNVKRELLNTMLYSNQTIQPFSTSSFYDYNENKKDVTVLSSTSSSTLSSVSATSLSLSLSSSPQSKMKSSSSTLSSSSISSTDTSTDTVSFISSGFIPFAKSSNITASSLVLTTFSAATTESTDYGSSILELFGYNFTYGSIFSNGQIVTAKKSFYETNLPSSEITSVSGSTFYTTFLSTANTRTQQSSIYIITVQYETHITEINSSTTMYGTSTITVTSDVPIDSVETNYSNGGKIALKNMKRTDSIMHVINIIGLSSFFWSLM
ncbi:hypothetical protein QEN19_000878 [Hanseniaspora menglaensis]